MAFKDKATSESDALGVRDGSCCGGSPPAPWPPGLGGRQLLAPEAPRAGDADAAGVGRREHGW